MEKGTSLATFPPTKGGYVRGKYCHAAGGHIPSGAIVFVYLGVH